MVTAGRFRPFDCVVVKGAPSPILLPIQTTDEILAQWPEPLLGATDFFRKVQWFYPAYIMKRFVCEVEKVVQSKGTNWRTAFEICLSVAYTPDYIATMVSDRYRAIPAIRPYVACIEESAEAFYFGFTSSAVASLIPSVEGSLSGMLLAFRSRQDQNGTELLKQVVAAAIESAADKLVYAKSWIPEPYRQRGFLGRMEEYVEMLEAFETFCLQFFFARWDDDIGADLNRHGVVHGLVTDYGAPANFYRLISILDLIAFIGSMNIAGVSCLAPNDTDVSRAIATRFKALALMGTACRLQKTYASKTS